MRFSIFTHDDPYSPAPGKAFREVDGKLVKKSNGALVRSKVKTMTVGTMAEFAELLANLDASQHLLAGISEHSECTAVPKDMLNCRGLSIEGEKGVPLVARSNDFFNHPAGEGLLVVDSDSQGETISLDEVRDALIDVCPDLYGLSFVQTTSSSSLVSGSNDATDITGVHTFIRVQDARDIPRALDVLHKRLILGGYARHKLSKTGAFLQRTFADRALRTPSQPIYVRARVKGNVIQKKQIEIREGKEQALDTRSALPDLTEDEERRLQEVLIDARSNLLGDMHAARTSYLKTRAKKLEDKGMSRVDAEHAVVTMLDNRCLLPDMELRFSDGEVVTVADILKDPDRYHERTCLDPVEPDYAGGRTVAKFYSHPQPVVHSFAHSAGDQGYVYRLGALAVFDALPGSSVVPHGQQQSITEAAKTWIDDEQQDIARTKHALDLLELRNAPVVWVDAESLLLIEGEDAE